MKRGLPAALVFICSFSILLLELAATRLVAKHIGSSLETWTAIIGILLAGVALGNGLGGRWADRARAAALCPVLLLGGACLCWGSIPVSRWAGRLAGWGLPWPAEVTLVVAAVLFPPSVLLGTVSPIAARLALDLGAPAGRTMGRMYAWGALGSLLGTYLTGFVLFTHFRVNHVIWVTGAVLAAMGVLTAAVVGRSLPRGRDTS